MRHLTAKTGSAGSSASTSAHQKTTETADHDTTRPTCGHSGPAPRHSTHTGQTGIIVSVALSLRDREPMTNDVGHVFNVPNPPNSEHVENVLHESRR